MAEFQVVQDALRGAGARMSALVEGRDGASVTEVGAAGSSAGDPTFAAALSRFCARGGSRVDDLGGRTDVLGRGLIGAAEAFRAADEDGGAAMDRPRITPSGR